MNSLTIDELYDKEKYELLVWYEDPDQEKSGWYEIMAIEEETNPISIVLLKADGHQRDYVTTGLSNIYEEDPKN